jgi:hypothetical protein
MDGFQSCFAFTPAIQVHGDLFGALSEVTADEALTYIFTTGALRSKYFANGGKKSASHHTVDVTLREVVERKQQEGMQVFLKYLTNEDEASYGFETLRDTSKDILHDVLDKARIEEDELVGVTLSGTTSFASGVYNRQTGEVSNMDTFDYGTNNRNPEGLEAYKAWMAARVGVTKFVSLGSESYAAPEGRIATNQVDATNEFLSGLDTTARAFEPVQEVLDAATLLGKTYYVPNRATWNAKTSTVVALRKKYPVGALWDWGGGQFQNDEKKRKIPFDQRVLMGAE